MKTSQHKSLLNSLLKVRQVLIQFIHYGIFFVDDTPVMYPSPNQESVNYSMLVNSKLASMCRMQNRCPFCLDQTTREGGHKSCGVYNDRISDHFELYFSRSNEHSLRVTPQYLYHYFLINSSLSEECLNALFPHIWEVFNNFYNDFYTYFAAIFKK